MKSRKMAHGGVLTVVNEVRLNQYYNSKRKSWRDCIELDCGHAVFSDHDESNASLPGSTYTCHGEHGQADRR